MLLVAILLSLPGVIGLAPGLEKAVPVFTPIALASLPVAFVFGLLRSRLAVASAGRQDALLSSFLGGLRRGGGPLRAHVLGEKREEALPGVGRCRGVVGLALVVEERVPRPGYTLMSWTIP
jgi:hypothetical protein